MYWIDGMYSVCVVWIGYEGVKGFVCVMEEVECWEFI